MVCPYRKVITRGDFKTDSTIVTEETFATCQGEACPLYNPTMIVPCVRANKERNEAYIIIRENEGGIWTNGKAK